MAASVPAPTLGRTAFLWVDKLELWLNDVVNVGDIHDFFNDSVGGDDQLCAQGWQVDSSCSRFHSGWLIVIGPSKFDIRQNSFSLGIRSFVLAGFYFLATSVFAIEYFFAQILSDFYFLPLLVLRLKFGSVPVRFCMGLLNKRENSVIPRSGGLQVKRTHLPQPCTNLAVVDPRTAIPGTDDPAGSCMFHVVGGLQCRVSEGIAFVRVGRLRMGVLRGAEGRAVLVSKPKSLETCLLLQAAHGRII